QGTATDEEVREQGGVEEPGGEGIVAGDLLLHWVAVDREAGLVPEVVLEQPRHFCRGAFDGIGVGEGAGRPLRAGEGGVDELLLVLLLLACRRRGAEEGHDQQQHGGAAIEELGHTRTSSASRISSRWCWKSVLVERMNSAGPSNQMATRVRSPSVR